MCVIATVVNLAHIMSAVRCKAMGQRRDQRGRPWLEDLLQDARFGARMLRRAPLVTAVALLTLTLAIGANSAIFSLVDPLLFRDVPVRDLPALCSSPISIRVTRHFRHLRPRPLRAVSRREPRLLGSVRTRAADHRVAWG